MRETEEGICLVTNKVELLLESKERRTSTITTSVSALLVSLRNNCFDTFLLLKNVFLKLLQKL